MSSGRRLFVMHLALLAACAEETAAPLVQPAPPGETWKCETEVVSQPDRLKRLTMTQYRNTVRDLVRSMVPDAGEVESIVAQLALEDLPQDRREPLPEDPHGSYRRLDQALEQVHVEGAFRVGATLGSALTRPEWFGSVVGACATDGDASNDSECLTRFIERVGARILRRPVDAGDLSFYREVYGPDVTVSAAAYADVIHVLFNAPEFLYFAEHGTREVEDRPGEYELSAHELASRLSYHFWQSLPDQELWQAAEDGSLLERGTYEAQVQRLVEDARTRATMQEFFADWLKVEDLAQLGRSNDPRYLTFAGEDFPAPSLRQSMIQEVSDMAWYYTWTESLGFRALFTREVSFARTEDLAAIYGVAPWDGMSTPPPTPAGQRPGLLTRALFLANGSANTRPIMKGVFLRRQLLCDDIPPPPPGVNAMPPELRDDMTTRQVVEGLTEQAESACAGCHASLINPLGFATENYDALGRFRTEQSLIDDQGNVVATMPVDTRTVPRVTPGDERTSGGPSELVQLMLESGKLEACLARNYFRFTYGRWEDDSRDACALDRLRTQLVRSGSIAAMLKEAALTPEFRRRGFD